MIQINPASFPKFYNCLMMLGFLFFIVAAFYAGVGFGGGSSYLALLVLWGLPYALIPIIALLCNVVVVTGSSVHYIRAGYLNRRLFLPLAVTSVPLAYLGGMLPIAKQTFLIILFLSLCITGLRLLVQHRRYEDNSDTYTPLSVSVSAVLGAILGFMAGVTGIGGGIFLAPILYNLRAGSPKQIAAISSLFILVNSISGLLGQLHKGVLTGEVLEYWYLPLLALAGGQLGNLTMLKFIPARIVALLTALLVLFVAGRLGMSLL